MTKPLHIFWALNDRPMLTILDDYNPEILGDIRKMAEAALAHEFAEYEPREMPDLEDGYELLLAFVGNVEYFV